MPRPLRFIPEDSLVEITCRTVQARYLLEPTTALNAIFLGALARSARVHRVRVHAFVFLSNHFHLLVSPPSAFHLACFMRDLNSKIAREAGRAHGWRDRVFARRYSAILVSQEPAAQVARLRYLLANGVKEGLVRKVTQWRGLHCAKTLIQETTVAVPVLTGVWFDRARQYEHGGRRGDWESREFAADEHLILSPLPAWKHHDGAHRATMTADMVNEIEREHAATTPAAMSQRRLSRARPSSHHRPIRPKRSPAPFAHTVSSVFQRLLREAYRDFVQAYRRAADSLRATGNASQFPPGSFPPHLPFVTATPTDC